MTARDPHFTEYQLTGSEEAFAALVEADIGMVHSTARRMPVERGDSAADVARMVFSRLVRKARSLSLDLVVSAWLHKNAARGALNLYRDEVRRAAADHLLLIAPDPRLPHHATLSSGQSAAQSARIDRALSSLPEMDQRALALRLFERRAMEEIGARLGLSAGAVQRRLSRALEKLRPRLERRGAVVSVTALTLLLTEEFVRRFLPPWWPSR